MLLGWWSWVWYIQLTVLRLSTAELFQRSLSYTNALGDARLSLPKLLEALLLLSREVFQAETSGWERWSRHSKHKYDLTNLSLHRFFNREAFRGSVALFFWRLWVGIQPWGPGTVSGITLPLTDFSLCPRFLFPFSLSPFIGHCLVRLVPTKIFFFHLTFVPVCKACKLLQWPLGLLYSRVVVPPCGTLWVALSPVFPCLPWAGWASQVEQQELHSAVEVS